MRLHFTLGYHLEGDGQTEHANQVLEQYLWTYMNYQQDDWAMLLLMAEFAYNNAMNVMTGVSPFFANKGYHPEFTADPQADTSLAEVQTFMADLECTQAELKENIAQAQERYWKNADKHRAEAPKLKVSDQAYVKAKFFRTRWPSKKLSEKNLGPFDVIGKPGSHPLTPSSVPLHPPSFPCVTTRTHTSQPVSTPTAATTATTRGQWRNGIQGQQDSRLQAGQML